MVNTRVVCALVHQQWKCHSCPSQHAAHTAEAEIKSAMEHVVVNKHSVEAKLFRVIILAHTEWFLPNWMKRRRLQKELPSNSDPTLGH